MGNLQFNLMSFVENLKYMGLGMLGVFIVITIIILAISALSRITAKRTDK